MKSFILGAVTLLLLFAAESAYFARIEPIEDSKARWLAISAMLVASHLLGGVSLGVFLMIELRDADVEKWFREKWTRAELLQLADEIRALANEGTETT